MFPLRYFFPVDPETTGDPQFGYGFDDPYSPEQPGKPPLITRYHLFFSILLALE